MLCHGQPIGQSLWSNFRTVSGMADSKDPQVGVFVV